MRRRAFLAMPAILAAAPSTDARIDELTIGFQDLPLSRALQVRRQRSGPRHHAERALPPEHARRQIGGGRRVHVDGQRVELPCPRRRLRRDARRDEVAGGKNRPHHAQLHGLRPSAGCQPRPGTRIPKGSGGSHARVETAAARSEAVRAGDGEPGGRGDPRCLRKTARPQQLYRVRQGICAQRSRALPESRISRRVPRPVHLHESPLRASACITPWARATR